MSSREHDSDQDVGEISLEDRVTFAENPDARCACVLLLDTSGSMAIPTVPVEDLGEKLDVVDGIQTYAKKGTGEVPIPIKELNDGIKTFKVALENNSLTSRRVETAIVSYNTDIELVQDFATVSGFTPPELEARGATSTATAVNFALDLIEERKQVYRAMGVHHYRPWIFLISDGASTDSAQQMQEASERVHRAEESKQLSFFCVGVQGANMDELRRIAPHRTASLRGLAFEEFFLWLSNSLTTVSSSRVEDDIQLSADGMSGWLKPNS